MVNAFGQRLLVSLLVLGTLAALGDEPKKAADHTICMGLQCTEGRRVRSEVQIPDEGDSEISVYEGFGCPRGLPIDQPLKTLPRGHAFIGKDKKQVIIELKNPERDLQDGDVLLSSYDTGHNPSPAAAFFDGSGHAALVGTVNGHKFHMDSPWEMSGRCDSPGFSSHGWTVLRMRRYPMGVNTPADLEKMRCDHPEKLAQWEKYRADVLKRVNQYFEAMRREPYQYNADYLNTKVFDKKTREAWREQLFQKDGATGKCPVGAVYCSELPTTGFALADEDVAKGMPRGLSILTAINAFEGQILKQELGDKKLDSPEGEAAFNRAWDRLVRDVGEGHDHLVGEFRRNEAKIKTATLQLLKLPREMRPAAFALFTSQVSLPVSPTDLYNDIFRENGMFSYVGTYVGSGCHPTEKIIAQGLPKAGESRKLEVAVDDFGGGNYRNPNGIMRIGGGLFQRPGRRAPRMRDLDRDEQPPAQLPPVQPDPPQQLPPMIPPLNQPVNPLAVLPPLPRDPDQDRQRFAEQMRRMREAFERMAEREAAERRERRWNLPPRAPEGGGDQGGGNNLGQRQLDEDLQRLLRDLAQRNDDERQLRDLLPRLLDDQRGERLMLGGFGANDPLLRGADDSRRRDFLRLMEVEELQVAPMPRRIR